METGYIYTVKTIIGDRHLQKERGYTALGGC